MTVPMPQRLAEKRVEVKQSLVLIHCVSVSHPSNIITYFSGSYRCFFIFAFRPQFSREGGWLGEVHTDPSAEMGVLPMAYTHVLAPTDFSDSASMA